MDPILLLFFLPPAALWGWMSLRRFGLWGVALLVLFTGTVAGYNLFHLSVITIDRLLLGIAIALYALYRYMKVDGQILAKPWTIDDGLVLLFLGWMTFCTLTHNFRINENQPIGKLLFFFLVPSALYWLGKNIQLTPERIRQAQWLFLVMGLYLAATAVAEARGWSWAVYPKYILSPKFDEFLGRGRGPLLNPIGNGILISFAAACGFFALKQYGKLGWIAMVPVMAILAAGAYATFTRSVWMGFALTGLILASVTFPWRTRLALGLIGIIVCVPVALPQADKLLSFKRDKNVSVKDMKESAKLRPILAYVAWKVFQDYPLAGVGVGQYLEVAPDYLDDRGVDLPLQKVRKYVQHNVFLAYLAETGAIGLGLFLLLLARWSYSGWYVMKKSRLEGSMREVAPLYFCYLGVFVINGVFHDVMIIAMMGPFLFFWSGVIRNLQLTEMMLVPHVLGERMKQQTLAGQPAVA